MKTIWLLAFCCLTAPFVNGQRYLDSLIQRMERAGDDTSKVLAWDDIASYYSFVRLDSASYFAQKAMALSEKAAYPYGKFLAQAALFFAFNSVGNYPEVHKIAINNLRLAEQLRAHKQASLATAYSYLGLINRIMSNFPEALVNIRKSISLFEQVPDLNPEELGTAYSQIGAIYLRQNKRDSILYYLEKGYTTSCHSKTITKGLILSAALLGDGYLSFGHPDLARKYYGLALQDAEYANNRYLQARINNNLSDLFARMGIPDSSMHYARASLALCMAYGFANYEMDAFGILARDFESGRQPDSAYKYLKKTMSIKDSLFGLSRIQQFMIFEFNEKQRLQELESAKESYRTQLKIIGLSTGLGILLLFALFLYRNNLQKRKSNQLLSHQKEDLENVLEKLKSTQAQLIHSEKMASLGELTAGIAHEIQNPLNFVNNFSEINLELIDEMEEELNKGNTPEVRLIAQNLRENNRRIDNHGKQAAGIVKGMLEHSRGSSVQKEPTHLKSFVDEYLRLSFHGYRVKDKSFHAVIQTDIDGDIGEVNVIRQEFGKVLLNLFNNAYYAMAKKTPIAGAGYEPTLLVTAKKTGHYIEILVKDNGIGIPKKILDKIFQPFFTTKPPGEGTGLGLSLCYDLIRAGGGEIGVESIEGEGTSFFIRIPA